MTGRERLLEGTRWMLENVRQEKIKMGAYRCGTAGCWLGWMAHCPALNQEGLFYHEPDAGFIVSGQYTKKGMADDLILGFFNISNRQSSLLFSTIESGDKRNILDRLHTVLLQPGPFLEPEIENIAHEFKELLESVGASMKPLPQIELLRECFAYNQETGIVRWKRRPPSHFHNVHDCNAWNARFAEKEAGNINRKGYRCVEVGKKFYHVHRIVWKLMTGVDPLGGIDHKNTTKNDNRWNNLRSATDSENACNRGATKKNAYGLKGVTFHKLTNKFSAGIQADGIKRHLGLFGTAEEAYQAYCLAATELHGKFVNLGNAENNPEQEIANLDAEWAALQQALEGVTA